MEGASVSSLEGQAEEPEIKLPAFVGSWRKHGTSRKNFCSIDYTKAFDCINHNKVWEILKEMGISDHLTCPLRNLYVGQEKTVRTTGSKLEKSAVATGLENDSFHSHPKERLCQECCNYHTIAIISYANKGMLKII